MSSLGNKLNNETLIEFLQNLNNETLKKLEAHTIAAPAFPINFICPVRCYFKQKEGDKKLCNEQEKFKKYLSDNNKDNFKCFSYIDKGGLLNETNPLSLAYKIKYDIHGRR